MGSVVGDLKSDNRLTALVVDDVDLIRIVHTMSLNFVGIDVVEAENGKVAVDICHSGKKFDLILMDKEMPSMDGLQATGILRSMGVKSLIVGMTAADENERKIFQDAGLDICYEKPLNDEKIEVILQMINNR